MSEELESAACALQSAALNESLSEPLVEQIKPESKVVELSYPISLEHIQFVKVAAWVIAIGGVLSGFFILATAPEGPRDYERIMPSNELLLQIKSANHLMYIVIGWTQIIGGVVTGSIMLMIGNIGKTARDLWESVKLSPAR